MQIDSDFAPWLSAANPKKVFAGSSLSITGVYFDKDAGQLIATDGRILTRFPVSDYDTDDSGVIPVEALKEAAKAGRKKGVAFLSIAGGAVKLHDGRSWPLIVGTYPDYKCVLSRFGALPKTRTARIRLNPALLNAIYAALAGEKEGALLEFELDDENDARSSPVSVKIGQNIEAVIMPIRLLSRWPDRVDDIEEAHALANAGGDKEFAPA